MEKGNIISLAAYRRQRIMQSNLAYQLEMEDELGQAIQALIQNLRECNPLTSANS